MGAGQKSEACPLDTDSLPQTIPSEINLGVFLGVLFK